MSVRKLTIHQFEQTTTTKIKLYSRFKYYWGLRNGKYVMNSMNFVIKQISR